MEHAETSRQRTTQSIDPAAPPLSKLQRRSPWGLFFVGVILFLAADWFALSVLDMQKDSAFFPFRTAGWFIMSLPFAMVISAAYSALFCLVGRLFGRKAGWIAMSLASSVLIILAIYSALPSSRLEYVIGPKVAGLVKIERLQLRDSFCDGQDYEGVLLGDDRLFDSIVNFRGLKSKEADISQDLFSTPDRMPIRGIIFYDDFSQFYRHPQDGKIHFTCRTRRPRHSGQPEGLMPSSSSMFAEEPAPATGRGSIRP